MLNNVIEEIKENMKKNSDNHIIRKNILREYDFKLPIEYHDHKKLSDIVASDIEFTGDQNIMTQIYNDNYNLLIDKHSRIYSQDKTFLKENQKFINQFKFSKNTIDEFITEYVKYKSIPDFMNKFQYIQISRFDYLNKNPVAMHLLGMYNFSSPFLSLVSPILGLILPYFILWFKGFRPGFSEYLVLIKNIVYNNYFIKGILNFHKNSLQTNAYTLASIFIYVMSVYNNIILCINYYHSLNSLSTFMDKYNKFLHEGKNLLHTIQSQTSKYGKFQAFTNSLNKYEDKIKNLIQNTESFCNSNEDMSKYGNMGQVLKCNYELFMDEDSHDTVMFIIYLNQYCKDLLCLKQKINDRQMNKCIFMKKSSKKHPKITKSYYLSYINHDSCVKNDVKLDKNIIITGPNASGKTTMIKSVLINLFLSQSCGFGCYDQCKTYIYDNFYSYLNIPDTSNRDSLFQAEARRCKEIIETISKDKSEQNFCIFDEIYSGTNPNDAVLCADIYLRGMNMYKKNVDYIITTHYIELCEKMQKEDKIVNKKMLINKKDDNFIYTYKFVDGISKVNGGFQVLKDLNYPSYLLDLHNA